MCVWVGAWWYRHVCMDTGMLVHTCACLPCTDTCNVQILAMYRYLQCTDPSELPLCLHQVPALPRLRSRIRRDGGAAQVEGGQGRRPHTCLCTCLHTQTQPIRWASLTEVSTDLFWGPFTLCHRQLTPTKNIMSKRHHHK